MKRIWTCLALLILAVVLAVCASAATVEISTADELAALMSDSAKWSSDIVLKANIDMTGKTQSPIGNATTPYSGTVDGGNYTIKGLNIKGDSYVGLFGFVDSATIKNLTLEGQVLSTATNGTGAFVGSFKTSLTFENCVNKCTVSTATKSGTTYTAGKGSASSVGGFAGCSENGFTKLSLTDCRNEGNITAARIAGGIVGWLKPTAAASSVATFLRVTNTGDVKAISTSQTSKSGGMLGVSNAGKGSMSFKHCYNSGAVSGVNYLGGIVGEWTGADTASGKTKTHSVVECWNSGTITATSTSNAYVGGLVGYYQNVGEGKDCLNTGAVHAAAQYAGGLLGFEKAYVKVSTFYTTTTVTVEGSPANSKYIRSVCGYPEYSGFTDCFYTTKISGDSNTKTGYNPVIYSEDAFGTLNANGAWVIASAPELKYFHTHDFVNNTTFTDNGDGTHTASCACGEAQTGAAAAQHIYGENGFCVCDAVMPISEITTAKELLILMNAPSLWTDGEYTLGNDIDLSEYSGTLEQHPIGNTTTAFTGTFDGDGHTISGLDLSGAGRIALFGKINTATIKNLTVEGTVSSTANCAAGIVAEAVISATIENCVNKCDVTITNGCIAAGGVVGYVREAGAVTIKNCENEGDITAARAVGGILGWLNAKDTTAATIEGCSNSGAIESTVEVTNPSADPATYAADAGGILGLAASGYGSLKMTQCKNSGSVDGYFYMGGIAGRLVGPDTSMTNAKYIVSECWNSGSVTSARTNGRAHIGGLIGYVKQVGNIYDCVNTGVIKGITDGIGGLFGSSGGVEEGVGANNCLNKTPVQTYGTATSFESYNPTDYVNSIGGYMPTKPAGTCYYIGTLQGKVWENANTEAKSTQYTVSIFSELNGDENWVARTSPELAYFHTHDNTRSGIDNGDGTHTQICLCEDETTRGESVAHTYNAYGFCICGASKVLEISTADELVALMQDPNGWASHYLLTADIDLSGKTQSPIGTLATPFTGTFDGDGHTISNLSLSGDTYIGLFGKVAGTIEQPVEIRNLTVSGTVTASGNYAGGIIAYAGMRDSSNSAVVIENCYNQCTVSGKQYVGGIVGYFYGSDTATNRRADNILAHCFNAGAVTATGEGGTENRADVGGIVGILWGVGDVNNCYATGKVTTGGKNAGGLIGRTYSYTVIRNCYVNAKVVASAEGLTNLQAFCGTPDYAFGYTDCYYNPNTMTDANTTLVREYDASAFDSLNADGLWLQVATPELLAFHTKHNNKLGLAWVDLGEAVHAPICPCGDESSLGTTVAHTYDANKVCTACGNADLCKHIKTETYIDGTPNCQTDVLSWERCAACHTKLTADGEETVIAASAEYHNFAWVLEGDTAVCKCTTDGCGAVATNVSAPETFTELYVSSAGYPFGGFSKEAPLNDYDMAMQIAATQDNDVVIYVLDRLAIPFPTGANSEYIYLEPAHTNTITVCGTEEASGVLYFGNADREMVYGLNGPTTFENIEFSFGNVSEYLFLTARHNPLVLGEGVSTDIHRVNDSDGKHTGLIYVIGGCYKQHFAGDCTDKSTDVTICSGTYRTIIGGHYSGKNCGNAGDISLKLLGNITTRNQICTGNVGVASGKITLTIDGNLSVGTFFTFGSQTATKRASETVVVVNSGSVVLNSFYANLTTPMSPLTIGSVDQTHNVLAYTDRLTVYTDENSTSAMALRKTILASVFSAPNQDADFADKVTFLFKGEDAFCAATGGSHVADGNAPAVTDSTCTVQGYETYHCSECEADYNVALPLAAHTPGEAITIAATCIAPEMKRTYCTVCGAVEHTIIGSTFAEHTDPEKTGFCQVCNKDLTADCEHAFGDAETFKSGCGDGTKRTCDKCGKVEISVIGDGHSYGKYVVTVEPTATMAGIKSRTCKGCGKVDTALLYATDALNASAVATDADGNLADLAIENAKLTKGEKAALNALLQQDAYGSEVKISYETDGKAITNITYSIPVPAAYTEYENVRVVVRDDDGDIHFVDFAIEKGYIVFTF